MFNNNDDVFNKGSTIQRRRWINEGIRYSSLLSLSLALHPPSSMIPCRHLLFIQHLFYFLIYTNRGRDAKHTHQSSQSQEEPSPFSSLFGGVKWRLVTGDISSPYHFQNKNNRPRLTTKQQRRKVEDLNKNET